MTVIVATIVAGAATVTGLFILAFSSQFSLRLYRHRQRTWGIGFTDANVRTSRYLVLVVGVVLVVTGIAVAIDLVR